MGDIKSTMDLVMEKTKHLSMTEEEKIEQKKAEAGKMIKGLVQKYQDGIIDLPQLGEEYEALMARHGLTDHFVLVEEVKINMDFTKENNQLLVLLERICGVDVSELSALLMDYQTEVTAETEKRKNEILRTLSDQHSIEGSSVLPNLEKDQDWMKLTDILYSKYQTRLKNLFQNT